MHSVLLLAGKAFLDGPNATFYDPNDNEAPPPTFGTSGNFAAFALSKTGFIMQGTTPSELLHAAKAVLMQGGLDQQLIELCVSKINRIRYMPMYSCVFPVAPKPWPGRAGHGPDARASARAEYWRHKHRHRGPARRWEALR